MGLEDRLSRQVDQFAKIFEKLLADLIEQKSNDEINDGIETTNQILKREINLDIQEFIDIPKDEFINILITEKNFSNKNLDTIADIFLLIADEKQDEEKRILKEKCLAIFEYLEKTENVFLLDRKWKIDRIKKELL